MLQGSTGDINTDCKSRDININNNYVMIAICSGTSTNPDTQKKATRLVRPPDFRGCHSTV